MLDSPYLCPPPNVGGGCGGGWPDKSGNYTRGVLLRFNLMAVFIPKLQEILSRIDGGYYKAYQGIKWVYETGELLLSIDHVQRDPFASPLALR